jgi:hypothetical protein
METAIIDRVELAIGMEHGNGAACCLDYLASAFGNLAATGGSDNLRQLVRPSGGVFRVDFDVIVA